MSTDPTVQQMRQQIMPYMPDQDCAALDCELLLASAMGCEPSEILAKPEQVLDHPIQKKLAQLVSRRSKNEPMAYIMSHWGFMDISLYLTQDVLVPRPETELLVELMLSLPLAQQSVILDLGTGSGAIALATAKNKPDWHVIATDISQRALKIAAHNKNQLVLGNVHLVCADWLNGLSGPFDLIVSNPPYIAQADPHLADLKFEPQQALLAGKEGMDHLHQIIRTAGEYLNCGGWLLLEHGHDQQHQTRQALKTTGFVQIQSHYDLNGHPRVASGRRKQ